ncbi:GNAT family N-acetyltransferase [Pseudoalteromonas sp. S16_S37]|uniref:GNAT family N-acetyltransferase n=1 Tax=Pseudoalteromonas sp. S16_S37 TaxID=2720228 RepID=UPI001681B76F|nr:GNAT family N-acetyltransferase [Pseudoalteromonas sp. S16_S37]MBD1583235.1 GNAT family N-acetyltransferase [Pseudoalteromonas sp. S16_S37]
MSYHVDKVSWLHKKAQLKQIRERVFVYELHIPKEVEFDSLDAESDHVIICNDNDEPVGTGRLSPDGLISRIAVIQSHRNRDAYTSLLNYLVLLASDKGLDNIYVNCILDEVPNFVENGFLKQGCVFMEAGIPRQKLRCPISAFRTEPFTMLH